MSQIIWDNLTLYSKLCGMLGYVKSQPGRKGKGKIILGTKKFVHDAVAGQRSGYEAEGCSIGVVVGKFYPGGYHYPNNGLDVDELDEWENNLE